MRAVAAALIVCAIFAAAAVGVHSYAYTAVQTLRAAYPCGFDGTCTAAQAARHAAAARAAGHGW